MSSDRRADLPGQGRGDPLAAVLAEVSRLLAARRPAEALALLDRLPPPARSDPRVAARASYGLGLQGRIREALAAARASLAGDLRDLAALEMVGNSLVLCHQPGEAYEAFRRAASLAPGHPAVLFNLATTARFLGRSAEAEQAYDRLIARAPDAWAAWRNRSELRRQTRQSNHVAALAAALARGPPGDGEVQLSYALGKEQEDLGDYEQAFASFRRGAQARRARMIYDVRADAASLALIAEVFDADWCAPGRAAPIAGEGPIFILGMPRTGSTLLEQMLGRHSQVQALGELQNFGAALIDAVHQAFPQPPADKTALIRAAASVSPERIGEAYLAAVDPLRNGRARFTDKLPLNFLYAGLIARALPQARIVHITRDPLDACVAIYKTLFEEAYPFSYDLAELGTYYRAYLQLMAHWRAALGERLIEVSYERLVAEPQAQLDALLARLGLALESACLTADAASPVMTASASQVREPVHVRSVGGAARYRAHLAPLFAALNGGVDSAPR